MFLPSVEREVEREGCWAGDSKIRDISLGVLQMALEEAFRKEVWQDV